MAEKIAIARSSTPGNVDKPASRTAAVNSGVKGWPACPSTASFFWTLAFVQHECESGMSMPPPHSSAICRQHSLSACVISTSAATHVAIGSMKTAKTIATIPTLRIALKCLSVYVRPACNATNGKIKSFRCNSPVRLLALQPHAGQDLREVWVGAPAFEHRVYRDGDDAAVAHLHGLVQPHKSLLFVAEPRVHLRDSVG